MKKGKIHQEGWQFCRKCKKETLHIPKLGLVLAGERLCTVCRCSNKYKEQNKNCIDDENFNNNNR